MSLFIKLPSDYFTKIGVLAETTNVFFYLKLRNKIRVH